MTQKRFTRADLRAYLVAFIKGEVLPREEGCPLYFEGPNNLWFQGEERAKPALLAVRTFDGAVNYRESKTEGTIHAKHTGFIVNRGELKRDLIELARRAGQTTTSVYQLTVQKANQTTLQRAVSFGDLDFSL